MSKDCVKTVVLAYSGIGKSQKFVSGTARLKLYKDNMIAVGRSSPYSQDLVTLEDDRGAYDQDELSA